MDISEMHIYFRQYAQQMGMQNVLAILPEQIDVLLNTSITDITNKIVRDNIYTNKDRIVTDNSKIGQINALRTLYKVITLDMSSANAFMEFLSNNAFNGKMSNKKEDGSYVKEQSLPDYLYLVNFSLSYKAATQGYSGESGGEVPQFSLDGRETNYFPVRIVSETYLAETLADAILKPSFNNPLIVVYNNDTFDIYIDKFSKNPIDNTYYLLSQLLPYKLRMAYIAKPAKVKYSSSENEENVNCDLPESLHIDIVKHAVDLYRIAVSGSLYTSRADNQTAQIDNASPSNGNEQ